MLGALQAGLCSRAPSSAFTPASVGSTLKLWLEGDVGLNQSGGLITTWQDQSGNANHASATGTPAYTASCIGGKPGVTSAAASYLELTAEPVAQNAARHIFAVIFPESSTLASFYTPRSGAGYCLLADSGAGQVETNNTTTNNNRVSGTFAAAAIIYEMSFDGTTTHNPVFRVGGVSVPVTNGVGTGVGAEGASARCRILENYLGKMTELVVCDTVLSAGNANSMVTYLATKYGL